MMGFPGFRCVNSGHGVGGGSWPWRLLASLMCLCISLLGFLGHILLLFTPYGQSRFHTPLLWLGTGGEGAKTPFAIYPARPRKSQILVSMLFLVPQLIHFSEALIPFSLILLSLLLLSSLHVPFANETSSSHQGSRVGLGSPLPGELVYEGHQGSAGEG